MRIGLPIAMVVVAIWAHVRISLSLRKRLELPSDMKAKVAAFEHQTAELHESLLRHIGKSAARQKLNVKEALANKEAAEAAQAVGEAPVPADVEYMPANVWKAASTAQQMAWEASGLRPAG